MAFFILEKPPSSEDVQETANRLHDLLQGSQVSAIVVFGVEIKIARARPDLEARIAALEARLFERGRR